ncbi:MAG: adenylate/guanylate cyclase domain-containing protein [Spirochaetes bacterium]|nr:MAG: adenylate/guanylate cyclase domain-containing protein [Spirochaetota bacterium]
MIKNDPFARSNWKMIAGLVTLLCLLLFNGFFGIYSLTGAKRTTAYFTDARAAAKDVQALFMKQVQTWKNLLLSREHAADYRAYYYEFSKYTARIQDVLFNLQMSLDKHPEIETMIRESRDSYGALSDRYVTLIFAMERKQDFLGEDPAAIMQDREEAALQDMERIVKAIDRLAAQEIERAGDFYLVMAASSLGLVVIVFIFMIVQIVVNNRNTQRWILRIGQRLNSYLPPQLAGSIFRNDGQLEAANARKHVSVCFTDLQGFTAMTEQLPPETTSRVLNEYLSSMTLIAHAWGGLVDKFIGDGIMIVFGALDDYSEASQARRCAGMAIEMQNTMSMLRDKWTAARVEFPLRLRIGINSGIATVGTFGPEDRKVYTAIGSVVNIASRLEQICPADKILLSETTNKLVADSIRCREIGEFSVKGIAGELRLYEITPDTSAIFKASQVKWK